VGGGEEGQNGAEIGRAEECDAWKAATPAAAKPGLRRVGTKSAAKNSKPAVAPRKAVGRTKGGAEAAGRGEGARREGCGAGRGRAGHHGGIAGAGGIARQGLGALLRRRSGLFPSTKRPNRRPPPRNAFPRDAKTRPDLVDERTVTYADSALSH
jgi:hypothetical protein